MTWERFWVHHEADRNSMSFCQLIVTHYEICTSINESSPVTDPRGTEGHPQNVFNCLISINSSTFCTKNIYTNSVFSHTKHSQINNLHIFTIVFHFRHTLFLHDLLIHSFYPFHMSDHHLAKGLFLLSSVHDFGIHYLPIPEIRILYQLSVPGSKHTSSKLHSLPRLFPISLDCLPGFWFLLFSFYALSNDT